MVLLNASTVSVVISGGIVCSFTFLLFLSGYVLQQQTVRSLQEALQAPIEERVRPRLNAARRPDEDANDTIVRLAEGEQERVIEIDTITGLPKVKDGSSVFLSEDINGAKNKIEQILIATDYEQETRNDDSIAGVQLSTQELWLKHIQANDHPLDTTSNGGMDQNLDANSAGTNLHLAYILSLPQPSDICSALLFAKTFNLHHSSLTSAAGQKKIPIILLYPSTWETSAAENHISAMTLLRDATHVDLEHNIQLHPVAISSVWTGVSISSQLLAELARNPWNYDRLLYLQSPGMLIDAEKLDWTLGAGTTAKTMKKDWTRLKTPSKRGAGAGVLNPEILLWAQGRGLMEPKDGKDVQRLIARADVDIEAESVFSSQRGNGNARDAEAARLRRINELSQAAYVLFDRNPRLEETENVVWQKFDRDRRAICEGSGLID